MKELFDGLFLEGNYKETFSHEVDKLIQQDLTDDFKILLSRALTDSYIEQTGNVPDSIELSKLATWLVVDKSRDPDKVANTEYPILSDSQQKLRSRRERPNQTLERTSSSAMHRINGKRKPKKFKVFGEYDGAY